MGIPVLIYGKSGSGKSRSLKNFAEDEIFYVNVSGKPLPFRKKFKYEFKSDNTDKIKVGLSKMPTKTAVIDDAGYLITNMFMKNHNNPNFSGNKVFTMYNNIADSFWSLFPYITESLPADTIVYIIMHEDTNENGDVKLKTIGKLLEDKVCLEGLVTICLRCATVDKKHVFRTVTDGLDITKAPEEMFEAEDIENDLKKVDDTIRDYWGLTPVKKQED